MITLIASINCSFQTRLRDITTAFLTIYYSRIDGFSPFFFILDLSSDFLSFVFCFLGLTGIIIHPTDIRGAMLAFRILP